MPQLFSFFFLLFGFLAFGQNNTLLIRVVDSETEIPIPNAHVAYSGPACILEKSCDAQGEVRLISSLNEKCFKKNTFYQIEVFGKEGHYTGATKQFYSGNLLPNENKTEVIKVRKVEKKYSTELSFHPGSTELFYPQSEKGIRSILLFAQHNPSVNLEIVGYYYPDQDPSLALERANQSRKKLLKRGLSENRIDSIITLPVPVHKESLSEDSISLKRDQFLRNDSLEVAVGFRVSGVNDFFDTSCEHPSGKYAIYFSIDGYEIVETNCSSEKQLEQWIQKNPKTRWKVVGVYHDQGNSVDSKQANDRAQIVKDILMMAGVDEYNIQPSAELILRSADSEELIWPFLPDNTPYETGVYIQKRN